MSHTVGGGTEGGHWKWDKVPLFPSSFYCSPNWLLLTIRVTIYYWWRFSGLNMINRLGMRRASKYAIVLAVALMFSYKNDMFCCLMVFWHSPRTLVHYCWTDKAGSQRTFKIFSYLQYWKKKNRQRHMKALNPLSRKPLQGLPSYGIICKFKTGSLAESTSAVQWRDIIFMFNNFKQRQKFECRYNYHEKDCYRIFYHHLKHKQFLKSAIKFWDKPGCATRQLLLS